MKIAAVAITVQLIVSSGMVLVCKKRAVAIHIDSALGTEPYLG